MRAFRIGDPDGKHRIFSGEGAARTQGRWHKRGQELIYCAQYYSTAMLEKLVHHNGILPSNQHFLEITVPAGVSYEVVTKDNLPNWDSKSGREARAVGVKWLTECRSAILIVPSVPAVEENCILINPNHPQFGLIDPGLEKPVRWDDRLFA